LYKDGKHAVFNLIAPEIFVYSGDTTKLSSELFGTGRETFGDVEINNLLFTKKGYDLPVYSFVATKGRFITYEDEKMEEEFSGRKGITTWFMEEFNKLYSVEQHRYRTLLNAIFEIVSKSALNNLRYGVLTGEALKKYKDFLGIQQD
ncbi:hypothetical protein, partial [Neisseria sp. P0024.S002]|uniref:hypothetical protein n=1 Tax=Neisseria sp. P0024.S002 TaxID=3436846 RepID=UPI003F81D9E0